MDFEILRVEPTALELGDFNVGFFFMICSGRGLGLLGGGKADEKSMLNKLLPLSKSL